MMTAKVPVTLSRHSPDGWNRLQENVIVETPVSLTVNGEVWLTFMCTPVHLEALAVGFLFSEGVIKSFSEVADVRLCEAGDNVDVWLEHSAEKPDKWHHTSGCTGGFTALEETADINPVLNGGVLPAGRVGDLIGMLFESQQLYRDAGGVHTSGLSDGEKIVLIAEDIGRHNTMDKLAGLYLMNDVCLERKIILTTGRISSEMLQKAARLGASILISRTSPSSLSINLAERLGVTLIGYARRNRFNVYSHTYRVISNKDTQENQALYSVENPEVSS